MNLSSQHEKLTPSGNHHREYNCMLFMRSLATRRNHTNPTLKLKLFSHKFINCFSILFFFYCHFTHWTRISARLRDSCSFEQLFFALHLYAHSFELDIEIEYRKRVFEWHYAFFFFLASELQIRSEFAFPLFLSPTMHRNTVYLFLSSFSLAFHSKNNNKWRFASRQISTVPKSINAFA